MEKKRGHVKVPDTCAEAAAIFYAAALRELRNPYNVQQYTTYAHALRLLGDTPLTANFVSAFDWEKLQ